MTITTRRMSDAHEDFLVELLGGTKMPGSGNQWNRPMDGRHRTRDESVAFAWDGKSTLGKSVSVTRAMWDKAVEQSMGARPMLALRWYGSERLNPVLDLCAIEGQDMAELVERSRRLDEIEARIEMLTEQGALPPHYEDDGPIPALVDYLRTGHLRGQ